MNLGQLIGELRYGKLEPQRRPELIAAADKARAEEESWRKQQAEAARAAEEARKEEQQRVRAESMAKARAAAAEKRAAEPERPVGRPPTTTRVRQISGVRQLLQKHPEGLSVGQIRAALGKAAPASITSALAALPIEKIGRRRHYVYRLFKNPPHPQE